MTAGDEFQALFDADPRPMLVFDRETLAILVVNEAACAQYGWSREEFLAMTIRDIRPPEERPHLDRGMADDGSTRTLVERSIHSTKSGGRLEVRVELRRLEWRGRPAALAVITNLSGVAETERRFRTLVEYAADGVGLMDERGVVLYMSPAGERSLGFAPGELVGRRPAEVTHPDDAHWLTAPPPGETRTCVVRVRRSADVPWRWIETTSTNLTQEFSIRAYVASFRDVTKRVEAEQLLRRSEANFRALIERAPTLILVHRDGVVRYVNPAAATALGYDSSSELVGKAVIDLVHPDDRAAVRTRMDHTKRAGGGAPGIARMKRLDGTYIATEGEGVLLDFDGEPSTVVLGRDVTERNEMFARMAVADRLVSVGTLAAGVAHEVNNPVSYVMSNLAIIADELPALARGDSRLSLGELETLVADAREGAARVSAIVRELRALSRSDEETTTLVDVESVLASSIKMAASEARHRAKLSVAIAPDLPPVRGNPSRLGQVFLNLLVNAAQAIPEGHPDDNEIRVRARFFAPNVVIEIEDTGAGIPRRLMGRIFDPFFTTKPIGVGTGLGLSISHEIIRSLGGAISVESKPGAGSTFRVQLPWAEGDEMCGAPAESQERIASGARVLMVDDDVGMGRSTRLLMAREYDIEPVTRAQDALARIARGERYDAIVCDLMMPGMSGLDFHRELERVAPEYASRVVFVTGGAVTDQARQFLARTTLPHVEKPFSEATLRAAIESVRVRDPAVAGENRAAPG